MSANPADAYGKDILCIDDADDLFSDVTGLAVVAQDCYHRLTNDSVLGSIDGEPPNEETDNWGFDVTRLVGMRSDKIPGVTPQIAAALEKDPRVKTAEVIVKPERFRAPNGQLFDLTLAARCTTPLGTFTLVLGISDVTVAIIGGSPSL